MIRLKCVSELLIYKFFKYNTADPKGKETVITMLSLPEDLDYTLTGLSAKYGNVCNKIAKNILNNILDAEECVSSSVNVEAEISAKELTRLIDLFLDTLDAESRILFVRRYWYSCSISELAEQFNLKSNTVSVRLSRIREKLRNYLKKEGITV